MHRTKITVLIAISALFASLLIWNFTPRAGAQAVTPGGRGVVDDAAPGNDPDLPSKSFFRGRINKADFLRSRDEHIGRLRGLEPDRPLDPTLRTKAIEQFRKQYSALLKARAEAKGPRALAYPNWAELGPRPVPNGQTQQYPATAAVTGRCTGIAVDPSDPSGNTVYVAGASGGVWRTTNSGTTWKGIFDSADSLVIGALALAPSSPTTLYVGTGEAHNSADSFFGVGVYRIDNAATTATLVGPINPVITTGSGGGAVTTNCFTGRAISAILVHPTDPATIFVSTASGVGGIGANALSSAIPPMGLRGVYRSTNATAAAASVTFTKLIVNTDNSLDSAPATGNTSIFDMVLEPGNPNNLLVTPAGTMLFGGVYRSTNALAPTPTFSQTLDLGSSGRVMKLAINKVGATVTVYVDSSEPSGVPACSGAGQAGRLRKSTDAGVTWSVPLVAAEGYCGGQCVYDNPVAVDPNNANIVYLGGNARGTCSEAMQLSTDGGATFIRDDTGLHADVQDIFIDGNTVPSTVWSGSDGGIWKRQSATAGAAWTNLNNLPLGTLQFQSLAVHPTDQFFTIGGTQDNGTEAQTGSNGDWVSAESGDGGFALIDQSATNTTAVTMYHTFFNQTGNFIGFDRTNLGACLATKDSWEWRGAGIGPDPTPACDGTPFAANNGISVTDTVLFYAPMALGPGTPNTLYFGTDRLYRSINRGDSMLLVSQGPIIAGAPISAIGIGRTNDNVRIVGLRNGLVFATTTGANPLVNTAFPIPANATASTVNRYVSRTVIDPTNLNTAYVTLSYYTNPSTAGKIWRTTNLSGAPPTWTAIGSTGNGLPDIPVNAFVVDASDATNPGVSVLYAGTDIGVYSSSDAGASWGPFGIGLPRVPVFDMAIQPTSRILRVATHGRGMWEINLPNPLQLTAAASRKKHGTGGAGSNFDVPMPLAATLFSGTSGVEPRAGGDSDGGGAGAYKIVFTFNNPVVFGDATVTAHNPASGTGTAGSASGSGNEMTIPLTGVSNGQVLTVTATGVTDGTNVLPSVSVNVGFLIGDTTASRGVNSSDIGQTKSRSGQTTNGTNFRSDVTVSGSINASDIGLVKSKSGTSMP